MKPDALQQAVYQAPATQAGTPGAAAATASITSTIGAGTWRTLTILAAILLVLAIVYGATESIRANNHATAYARTLNAFAQAAREPATLAAAKALADANRADPVRVLAAPGKALPVAPDITWAAQQAAREFPLPAAPAVPDAP